MAIKKEEDTSAKEPAQEGSSEIKLPATLGGCVDLLYKTRQQRYKLNKAVEALEKLESAISEHLINEVPKGESSGVAGKIARVSLTTKPVPQVTNWEEFYKYVKRTGSFELLQKRLATKAVEERWENKKPVPGVDKYNAIKISLNKL